MGSTCCQVAELFAVLRTWIAVTLKRKPLVNNTVYSDAAKQAAERLQKERTYRSKVWLWQGWYAKCKLLLNYPLGCGQVSGRFKLCRFKVWQSENGC
jgi:hypothetical protein